MTDSDDGYPFRIFYDGPVMIYKPLSFNFAQTAPMEAPMNPNQLITLIGSVCPKFDVNMISASNTLNPRVARGYKAVVTQKLTDELPDDFKFKVTEDFKETNPVGAFYVDGRLSKTGARNVQSPEGSGDAG